MTNSRIPFEESLRKDGPEEVLFQKSSAPLTFDYRKKVISQTDNLMAERFSPGDMDACSCGLPDLLQPNRGIRLKLGVKGGIQGVKVRAAQRTRRGIAGRLAEVDTEKLILKISENKLFPDFIKQSDKFPDLYCYEWDLRI